MITAHTTLKGLFGFRFFVVATQTVKQTTAFLNGGFLPVVHRWIVVSKQRRDLEALPDYLLKDIGINRDMVKQELAKPFWKI